MIKTTSWYNGERYHFDCKLLKQGYLQLDTTQDTSYYGMWIDLEKRIIVEFTEGDVCKYEFDSDREMGVWVKAIRWFKGVDGGLKVKNIEKVKQWTNKYGIKNY